MRVRILRALAVMAAAIAFVHAKSADHWPASTAAAVAAQPSHSVSSHQSAPQNDTPIPVAALAFATVIGSTVRAKVRCNSKQHTPGSGTSLSFGAVYSDDPNSENKSFSDATPNLSLSMSISDGKPAADSFEQGKEYYLTFTPADASSGQSQAQSPNQPARS